MSPSFSKLSLATLAVAAALVDPALGFWRLPCRARTALARIDPLADYGHPSAHAHTIHGSGNFGFEATYDQIASSDCTSCGVKQDKSVYWTPPIYFEHPDGTTELVEQVGGMLSYYLLYGENIKAFPKGFNMIAGNTNRRTFPYPTPDPPKSEWSGRESTQKALEAKALGFNCLNYQTTPEGSLERHQLPSKEFMDANCLDGIRIELMFPSCWDGENVDSPNHKTHVQYPSLVNDGVCPPGFETRIPSLFYETIWNTFAFAGKAGRFILANSDGTGNGYHGDFMTGWDPIFLQQAVNTCTNPSGEVADCPLFNLQSDDEAAQCKIVMPQSVMTDDCEGPRKGLCGHNEIGGHNEAPPPPEVYTPEASTPSTPKYLPPKPTKIFNTFHQAAPSPHPTEAPDVESPADPAVVVTTKTYTSDGAVYEVVVEEVDVTVVETTTTIDPALLRRHVHHHHRHFGRRDGSF